MKKILFIFTTSLLISTSLFGVVTDPYPPMNSTQKVSFERQTQLCLIKSRQRVNNLIQEMGKAGKMISPADRIRLESAKTAMIVKTNLINNLIHSEVMNRSSILRLSFTDLLKKENITEIDLLKFQSEIDKTKILIREKVILK